MSRVLPILRARTADAQSLALHDILAAAFGEPPLVASDDRAGGFDSPGARVAPLNEARLAALGLTDPPPDWGWLCGDFCYYAAAAAAPGYDRYLLVESDVYLPLPMARLLAERARGTRADGVAARLRLGEAGPAPRYSRPLRRVGLPAEVGCLFPLTLASPGLIAAMRRVRDRVPRRRPRVNDEAVFASALMQEGLAAERLEVLLAPHVDGESFRTNPPFLLEALEREGRSDLIRHPAVPLATVLARIASGQKAYHRRRLREIMAGATAAERDAIEAALASAPGATAPA